MLYILAPGLALKLCKGSHEVLDPGPAKPGSCWTHVYLGSGPKLCLNSCKTNPVRFSPGPCLGLEWVKCLSLCLWCNFLGSELMVLRTGPKIAFSRIWNFERLNSWQFTIDFNHGGSRHTQPPLLRIERINIVTKRKFIVGIRAKVVGTGARPSKFSTCAKVKFYHWSQC